MSVTHGILILGLLVGASICGCGKGTPGDTQPPPRVPPSPTQIPRPPASPAQEFAKLLAKAEQGDAQAQSDLATKYAKGEGVTRDFAVAAKWYRKAAEQGHAYAQYNMGYMYYNGEGLPRDYPRAEKWLRKAAEQGNAGAQTNLGLMYDNGEGGQEDNDEALKWYRKAAAQGEMMALFNMGWMYDFGEGVAKDKKVALDWYLRAAKAGHHEVANFIGEIYDSGAEGVPEDDVRAYAWWIIGVERGDDAPRNNMETMARKLSPKEMEAAKTLADQLQDKYAPKQP